MDVFALDSLASLLEQSAYYFPDRTALGSVGGKSYTYAQLFRLVRAAAVRLKGLGVRKGDHVAILSENRVEWAVAYFSAHAVGAIAVPILADFIPADAQNILQHSECVAVFVSARCAPKLEGATFPALREHIAIESLTTPETEAMEAPWEITDAGRSDDLAAIVYTSGTTGFSKGVMLSHRNILSDAQMTVKMVDINLSDRMLSVLPLAHTYECTLGLVTPLMIGASVFYLDRPPSANVLLPAMAEVKPTVMLSVPLIIEKIYKARVQPFFDRPAIRTLSRLNALRTFIAKRVGRKLVKTFGGELRLFCIGGAPLAADVEEFLRLSGFPYAIGYGLTETSPMSSGDGTAATHFRAAGRALPGVSMRIDHPDLNTGEGEILIKGPHLMVGYYNDPEKTAEVLTKDGWFHTGDLGIIDAEGYVFIKGRLKSLILGPSGKNIYPEEIESALNEFDIVVESVVFQHQNKLVARAHLNYEMLKHRFGLDNSPEHQLREHIVVVLEDIRKQVNARLAHFSRLHRIIDHQEPFEKTPTQKIKRHLYKQ